MVDKSPQKIRGMFSSIVHCYDFMNHLMTFQQDRLWRRRVIKIGLNGNRRPIRILDLCTGTGDMALGFGDKLQAGDLLVAADFTEPMLRRAGEKADKRNLKECCNLVCGDALQLPFADNSFDVVTIGFGVRNFSDMNAGLEEIHRVLDDGGKIIVLETSQPKIPIMKWFAGFYFNRIMPMIGRVVSGTGSYSYLRDSGGEFPGREEFKKILERCGFKNVEFKAQSFGAVAIHTGRV